MARLVDWDTAAHEIKKTLSRSFQSGDINFLIGSGASAPAIPPAGAIESEIASLLTAGNDDGARARLYDFLEAIQISTNHLIDSDHDITTASTLENYQKYIETIEKILVERRSTILPKQASIFSTNYDLFLEKAAESCKGLKLNDGFSRGPSLTSRAEYSSRNFFNTTYNVGNLYSYRVQLPCINLIKLHGSLSWRKAADDLLFQVERIAPLGPGRTQAEVRTFVERYEVVLPEARKFRTTLMDRTYYELLRIYSNQLDCENSMLISFGFSFRDEHIRDITKRALKNPTLRVVAIAHDTAEGTRLASEFDGFNNVEIIASASGGLIGFTELNSLLGEILPFEA